MRETPKGLRLQIGVFGRRNVGKSSLLNALTGQDISIVSDTPGTTTDPVDKAMELAPLGPVLFIDTAGVDDVGALGALRRERTERVVERADIALIVTDAQGFGEYEYRLRDMFAALKTPYIAVVNKIDTDQPEATLLAGLEASGIPVALVSALTGEGVGGLKERLVELTPDDWFEAPRLVGDLLPAGELAMLVVPIDLGAPKGRLILPQVQAIRDILDSDACCMVVKERELRDALNRLRHPPGLVVCDSQVVLKTAGDTPPEIPLTTFSILMARFKGDLPALASGAAAIESLQPGDRVLIAEACTHHPLADDIGRVKIPRWLRQYTGVDLEIEVKAGADFPHDLRPYALIIHCAACVVNRKAMLARLFRARRQGVPMTNYGVAISFLQGLAPRVLRPFPAALAALEDCMALSRASLD